MHSNGLADDKAIGNQFADGLARVGIGDFVDLVGIEPDLALATADDGGRQTLLSAKVDPTENDLLVDRSQRGEMILDVMKVL